MSRARSVWLVARRELFERGRSRGFIFSVLFTTTIIIGSFVVPAAIIGDEGPTHVGVVEPAPEALAAAIGTTAGLLDLSAIGPPLSGAIVATSSSHREGGSVKDCAPLSSPEPISESDPARSSP